MKLMAVFFLLCGALLLIEVGLPILNLHILESVLQKSSILISPQSDQTQVLGVSIQTFDNFPAFISSFHRETKPPFNQFSLSVPSLKIDDRVEVDSNDLTLGLVHLPGSALPGEKGNMFISGHSALPLFSDSLSAKFANLPKIKKGDQILITALGAKYIYKVVDMKIVHPKETSVILPPDEKGRYVTLMTCVPPGLNTKRLVILGKLI